MLMLGCLLNRLLPLFQALRVAKASKRGPSHHTPSAHISRASTNVSLSAMEFITKGIIKWFQESCHHQQAQCHHTNSSILIFNHLQGFQIPHQHTHRLYQSFKNTRTIKPLSVGPRASSSSNHQARTQVQGSSIIPTESAPYAKCDNDILHAKVSS